jgi:hypothetical protein
MEKNFGSSLLLNSMPTWSSAVVLVPYPIQKVKKVMFCYILELLNGEGPWAFFDLTKGTRIATQAQKEKRQLA